MSKVKKERADLFEIMIKQVEEIANKKGLKDYEAFVHWFINLYYKDKNISDINQTDGKSDGDPTP
ncbi:MAG: hypothetical protein JXB49_02320 [Bacteroidales bacterium]|nr:hypothetical protein [Bacteroidales bacterium]